MLFTARQLREIMAQLGVRKLDELVGRTDLLKVRKDLTDKQAEIDLSKILLDMSGTDRALSTFQPDRQYDFQLEKVKDETVLLSDKGILRSLDKGNPSSVSVKLDNTDRTFGTLLGAEITRRHPEGLPEDTITVNATGYGGQSFGSFPLFRRA